VLYERYKSVIRALQERINERHKNGYKSVIRADKRVLQEGYKSGLRDTAVRAYAIILSHTTILA
jgi:hypothetical protein